MKLGSAKVTDHSQPQSQPRPARIDLLRHGSVSGGDCFRGWQDDPLDAQGWRQMWQAVGDDCTTPPRWQRIISSPLQRCAGFAQTLAERCQLRCDTDPRWRELSFGDWEGRTAADIHASEPQALQAFWDDPVANPPPAGESLATLQQRSAAAWDDMLADINSANSDPAADGSRWLLVTHAGVIRSLLCRLLEMPTSAQFRFEVPHAALITVIADPQWPRLALGGSPFGTTTATAVRSG